MCVRIGWGIDSVERLDNGHIGDRKKWPFLGGGGCKDLKHKDKYFGWDKTKVAVVERVTFRFSV